MLLTLLCFNPRARAGRDMTAPMMTPRAALVSIHAPARGATAVTLGCIRVDIVSIHAPARGATDIVPARLERPSFNPRARAGRDGMFADGMRYVLVSIHAPARGATFQVAVTSQSVSCFNPRARAGRDHLHACQWPQKPFQSTRPRGARPTHAGQS